MRGRVRRRCSAVSGSVERLAGGDQQLLVVGEIDLATARGLDSNASRERAVVAARRWRSSRRGSPGLRVLIGAVWPAGQVTVPASRSIVEVALAQAAVGDRALGHRREHVDVAFGEFGADRPVAVGGVARAPASAVVPRAGRR